MNEPDKRRLPWEAHPEGGFIAYPEGKDHTRRFARVTKFSPAPGKWSWSVTYDTQAIANVAESKQAAADAATDAWPSVIEREKTAREMRSWESRQLEMIAAAERGEIPPDYFANEHAKYENMMWVMDRIKPRPGNPVSVGLQKVVDALSREFARRRG